MKRERKTKNPELQNELNLGYINLEDGLFDLAKMNFEIVMSQEDTCSDAYWGMMLAKLGISNEDDLLLYPTKYKSAISLIECDKALNNANRQQKKIYGDLLIKIYRINEGDNY